MNYKDLANDTTAWNNKGTAFAKIGRYYEANKML
jgi:hypothetical protein